MTAFVFGSAAAAQEKGFGLGIVVGEPTGICFKRWVDENSAFAGAAAWSFTRPSALHVHVDYLLHRRVQEELYFFHYGIGGRIKFEKGKSRIGIRIPLGITYPFPGTIMDMFIEISPLLDLMPATEFGVNGTVGFRYFFE
ncbi:hypothetical protein IBX65_02085 [Candidatus Aerophobetes bacterium]|nr:hypothetical protein [Candidatus Aerophobetes bacterium]